MRRIIGALALLAVSARGAIAATYHLDAAGTGDFPTIAAAIAAAAPGDSIRLAAGLYLGAGNTQLDYGGKDIVIAGAGPGATILDCMDSGVPAVRFTNGESRAAVLRDMTLRNNFDRSTPPGIYIYMASPTLAGLELLDFDAVCGDYGFNDYTGAAINCREGSPLVIDTEIRDCGCAGSIGVFIGAPVFERVSIVNGRLGYGSGSGMYLSHCAATVRDVTIRDCYNFDGGGAAVYCSYTPSPLFEDCRFESNLAESETGAAHGGGALLCERGAIPIFRRCLLVGNDARDGGGGIAVRSGAHPTLEDVLIADCGSDAGGSAVYLNGASATLRGVTITGGRLKGSLNEQNVPSAILCLNSSPLLEQVIIAHNEVGFGVYADATSAPDLTCSDVCGNPDGNYGGSIADPTGSDGNISLDPLFCGGAEPETAFTLGSGSPCAPPNNSCGVLIGALSVGCDLVAVRISGRIALAAGEPIGGVSIEGAGYLIRSDSAGAYELMVPVGWSGTLTPICAGYEFTPVSRSYGDLATDALGQDFTATRVTLRRVPAAYPTIQAAIDFSLSGDIVLVAPGTYSGPGFRDITLWGKDVYIISEAGSAGTIIDCENSGRGFQIGSGVSSSTWIMGFTVRRGSFNSYPGGGGLYVSYASPILRDLVIENCQAKYEGAGIKLYYSGALLEDVVVRGCECYAPGYSNGGGIYCMQSAPTLRRVLLAHNISHREGGGLYCHNADPVLEQVTIVANSSTAGGGVSCDYGSAPVIAGCLIANNGADSGGGLYCHDAASSVAISCSDVVGNASGDYGGTLADQTGLNGNISESPRFCYFSAGDYTLDAASPCLPANNDCHEQMGAFGEGCTGTTAEESVPAAFAFAPPQPNPFNPKTTLRFALPRAATVDLAIFDVNGRRVAHLLADEQLPAGNHAVDWNGRDEAGRALPSGVYFACFAAGGFAAEHKLVLLR